MKMIKKHNLKIAAIKVFECQAEIYAGLYHGIYQASHGKGKNIEKTIREFYKRTTYKAEDKTVADILKPVLESNEGINTELLTKVAQVLYKATKKAKIKSDKEGGEIVITTQNFSAYSDWDDGELNVDDKVEIVKPAWYQNNKVIETGFCRVTSAGTK